MLRGMDKDFLQMYDLKITSLKSPIIFSEIDVPRGPI